MRISIKDLKVRFSAWKTPTDTDWDNLIDTLNGPYKTELLFVNNITGNVWTDVNNTTTITGDFSSHIFIKYGETDLFLFVYNREGIYGKTGIPTYRTNYVLALHTTPGPPGEGMPEGGTGHQVLTKVDDTDFNTEWRNPVGSVETSVDIIPTLTVGGYTEGSVVPAGTSFQAAFEQLVAPYIKPTFKIFAINPGDTIEIGTQITLSNAYVEWNRDSTGKSPKSIEIVGTGFNTVTEPNEVDGNITVVSDNSTIIKTSYGSETWTLKGIDRKDNVMPQKTDTVRWYYRAKLGASNINVVDTSTAQTVYDAAQKSVLTNRRAVDLITPTESDLSDHYTYIMYYAVLGDITKILADNAETITGAFFKVGDFTINNSVGHSVSIRVYRTNATKAFAGGITLNIK